MTDKKSETYFILADNVIHIIKDGLRLCTDESDFNVKYDLSVNLFAIYCPKCQSKKFQ